MSQPTPSCSCGGQKKKVLVFSCSGAANVAEVADRVARKLNADGNGQMYCLAGVGAGIPNMVQAARDADLNLVIDGCPMDCARKIFENHKLTNVRIIRVTDHGIQKSKGIPATPEQIEAIHAQAITALA